MRLLEDEVMMSAEEVAAYDILVKKYFEILHAGFVETVINLGPACGKFLDVGTGTGWIALGVAKYSSDVEVVGVDLSETMLSVARRNAVNEGVSGRVDFRMGDAKGLPFEDSQFDAVFCHNMLHHLQKPELMVAEMKRVVKDDGALIIRDLVRHSRIITELHVNLFGVTYSQLMKKEYRDSILASLSRREWVELFTKANLGSSGRISHQFVTHQSIERPSTSSRNDYVEVSTPYHLRPLKNMYVSKR